MNHRFSACAILLLVVLLQPAAARAGHPAGPFLAANAPGGYPTPLAPEFVSAGHKALSALAFTPDGAEAAWSAAYYEDQIIFMSRLVDGAWTDPFVPPFADGMYCGGPVYTDGGESLLFTSKGPYGLEDDPVAIWITRRDGDDWTDPEPLTDALGAQSVSSQFSVADNGDIYLAARIASAAAEVFVLKKQGAGYAPIEPLPRGRVNTIFTDIDPWVDPSGRFLLYTGFYRLESFGSADIYISLRLPDGGWSPMLNLGFTVNTSAFERFASVAPDGRTLTFLRAGGPRFPSEVHGFQSMDFEIALNNLGYDQIRACNPTAATAVFTLVTALYPDSWNAWDSLADGCKHAGDWDRAEKCYRRAGELNPAGPSRRSLVGLAADRLDIPASTDQPLRHAPGEQTGLRGPYLGQTPPGDTPELFAPGIVSACGRFEYALAFAPDGRELYFSTDFGLMVAREADEGWTAPQRTPFSGFEPWIAADGERMFICRGPAVLMLDRTETGWSEGTRICDGMRPCADAAGNLYVTRLGGANGTSRIALLRPEGDGYGAPIPLAGTVNDGGAAHPCVSASGRILIFDSLRVDDARTNGHGDLFVSRRTGDGGWSSAARLPDGLNTPGANICAALSPDGAYLFYTANNDIYWVRTEAAVGR